MTRLVLEIPTKSDLEALLPLLNRLRIRYSKLETSATQNAKVAEAIRVVRQGCDMSNFGDALEYQIEQRRERSLPNRD